MERVLGLDLGTNSLGWAIINRANRLGAEESQLLERGTLLFQEGVDIDKGVESSKAAKRTSYRALKRHYFRRKLRKIETLKSLSKYGLSPELSEELLKEWQSKGVYPLTDEIQQWQRTEDKEGKNPYSCRYEAINRKLNLSTEADRYLLGRAFYHIAQRRGFLSNRKDSSEESEGAVKSSISSLSEEIEQSGARTLGEYFYRCYGVEKIRSRYTSRLEHYKAEFDEICRVQKLNNEMKKEIERAIFYQRPLRSQKGLVGNCTFERGKPRCPISHPRFEHYRMLCFINNIRIKTIFDSELRPLTADEVGRIVPLFLRKSKSTFDFEDIAKVLSGKGNYAYYKEPKGRPYLFNYKLNTTVCGSPFTAQLKSIFGDSWAEEIATFYTKAEGKSIDQIVNDIWHVLFSFDSEEHLVEFAKSKLQLSEKDAIAFSKIKVAQDYAALSLKAINKIIPFLERGLIYSHATFLANIRAMINAQEWEQNRESIINGVLNEVVNYDGSLSSTIQENIIEFLRNKYTLKSNAEELLYHPSMIETYPESKDGRLGSPRTNAIRNPMAMRAMFQLRKLVNRLLAEGKIDPSTKINVELVRQLNNANMRKAMELWQRDIKTQRDKDRGAIIEDLGIEPTEDDLLKYQLWREQEGVCLYTGRKINLKDFIGADPLYDIEHTVPRSRGGDDSQMNKTLAYRNYNREVKRDKCPSELADYEAVKVRIEPWLKKVDSLDKRIERSRKATSFSTKEARDTHITKRNRLIFERDYWRGKCERIICEEPERGFKNSQGVDAGIISKYAVHYLRSLFPNVYPIKGSITSEFRKLWGLSVEYEKKSRDNHIHHCIDAITIACIGKRDNDLMSHYYRQKERSEAGEATRPAFPKPWATFTEDVKGVGEELFVAYYTPDNVGKHTRKRVRVRGKVVEGRYTEGDTARVALHQESYYGAIKRDDEVKYVIRKSLSSFTDKKEVERIVDDVVREKVQEAVDRLGFKVAIASDIWMNEEKRIPICKVRCFVPNVTRPLHIRKHRDVSRHEHKQQYHVVAGGNYIMAIYEGADAKGKVKRGFEILSNYIATEATKKSADKVSFPDLVPISKDGLPLRATIKTGTMVLFWENSPSEIWELDKRELQKRLYKVTGMSTLNSTNSQYGRLEFRHHQEARPKGELKAKSGLYKEGEEYRPIIGLLHTQLNALVEGVDFELTILGEIKPLKR